MTYLGKLLFVALIFLPLLFAGDDNKNIGGIGDDNNTKRVTLSQYAAFSTQANIDLVEPISCCDFLIPDIEYWLFGYTVYPDATKIQWDSSVLEKLSFGQLMTLVKEGETDPKNLLWIPLTQFVSQRRKTE